MAVSTNTDGNWKTASGTLSEVIGQLNSDNVKKTQVISAGHDGTNYFALYYTG